MASKFVLVVNTNNDGNTTASEIAPNVAANSNTTGAGAPDAINNIATFLQTQVLGRGINVVYIDTAVAASGTGTFTGAATADQTMNIAGQTFTAKATPDENANQYLVSADVSLAAASLARAINNSTGLAGVVTATSNLGVVTITASVPGNSGNGIITLDTNTSNFTFAGDNLTGGSQAHRTTLSAGL
jgi:hypothetical protein